MEEAKYDLVFRGQILPGRDLESVKQSVAERFRVPPERIEEYFSGRPVTLARGVDAPTAARYKASLEATGAACEVVSQGTPEAGTAPPPAARETVMTCPKCGFQQPKRDECVRCGIVVGRFEAAQAAPAPARAPMHTPPARKGFFQNPLNLVLAGVAGALVLVILGSVLFKLVSPKNPPRAEYLKIADDIMASADTICEVLDSNEAYSGLSKANAHADPNAGLSTEQLGVVLQETGRIWKGQGSQVLDIQKEMEASGTPQQVGKETLRLKTLVSDLKKKGRRSTPEHRAQITQLEELLTLFETFSQIALHPADQPDLIRYHGQCNLNRIFLVGLYAVVVESIRGMNVKESEYNQLAFETEDRTASANIERYRASRLLK